MTTTPTSGAADLPEALRVPLDSLHADAGYLCGRLLNGSLTQEQVVESIHRRIDAAKLAALAAGQATAAQPAAPARDLAAVIKGAADKLDAAVRCHPNAVDTLIHEALEILDGDREPDATPASHGQAPSVEREQERIAFKDAHRHLDLDEVPDAWGPMFKHSHVEASWLGWIARASHGQAPAGDWLWVKLMDFCKKRRFAPANFNDLFEIVDAARAARAPADSVLEDAARYRFIRDVPYSDDVRSVLVHQQNAAMDRVIDAARKQGENHDNS